MLHRHFRDFCSFYARKLAECVVGVLYFGKAKGIMFLKCFSGCSFGRSTGKSCKKGAKGVAELVLDRIRILKTGLFGVERYLDMSEQENVAYFERLAEPGTHLTLRRVKDYPEDPFRIDVFGPEEDRSLPLSLYMAIPVAEESGQQRKR